MPLLLTLLLAGGLASTGIYLAFRSSETTSLATPASAPWHAGAPSPRISEKGDAEASERERSTPVHGDRQTPAFSSDVVEARFEAPTSPKEVTSFLVGSHVNLPADAFFDAVILVFSEGDRDHWDDATQVVVKKVAAKIDRIKSLDIECRQNICRLDVVVVASADPWETDVQLLQSVAEDLNHAGVPIASFRSNLHRDGFTEYLFSTMPAAPYIEPLWRAFQAKGASGD
jgi:hypothetical protein